MTTNNARETVAGSRRLGRLHILHNGRPTHCVPDRESPESGQQVHRSDAEKQVTDAIAQRLTKVLACRARSFKNTRRGTVSSSAGR